MNNFSRFTGSNHHEKVRSLHNQYAKSNHVSESTLRPGKTRRRDLVRTSRHIKRTLGLSRDCNFFDFGCGHGELSKHLLRDIGEYVGVDYSQIALEVFSDYCVTSQLNAYFEKDSHGGSVIQHIRIVALTNNY